MPTQGLLLAKSNCGSLSFQLRSPLPVSQLIYLPFLDLPRIVPLRDRPSSPRSPLSAPTPDFVIKVAIALSRVDHALFIHSTRAESMRACVMARLGLALLDLTYEAGDRAARAKRSHYGEGSMLHQRDQFSFSSKVNLVGV